MIVALFLASCSPPPGGGALCEPDDAPLLVAATTDFSVGALATVRLEDLTVQDALAPTGGDPLVVSTGGELLLVSRSAGDSIRRYRPGCWSRPELEFALDPGANAHDVARVGDDLFVAPYEEAALVVYDDAGVRRGAVDLAELADADGLPEPEDLVVLDGRLYAALQNLERSGSVWAGDTGLVVEVDPAARAVTRWWEVGPNPKLFAHPARPGQLVILTGLFWQPDGALRILDIEAGTLEDALGEGEAGFDMAAYAEIDGVGVVAGPGFALGDPSGVRCIDWETGGVAVGPSTPGWYADAAAAGGWVWLAARASGGEPGEGLVPLDPTTCAVAAPSMPLFLEPYSLAAWP